MTRCDDWQPSDWCSQGLTHHHPGPGKAPRYLCDRHLPHTPDTPTPQPLTARNQTDTMQAGPKNSAHTQPTPQSPVSATRHTPARILSPMQGR